MSDDLNLRTFISAVPTGANWVIAYEFGPGFVIGQGTEWKAYRYIDPVYFAQKSSLGHRIMGLDTARYGARSLDVVGNEIFMLFGGRPRRYSHAAEPTLLIDVYDLNGRYLRSMRLPFHARSMQTDGDIFFVLTDTDEGLPTILGLRPRR